MDESNCGVETPGGITAKKGADGTMTKTTCFDQPEYDRRLANCREVMQQKGIDVLIDSDPANMNYLTGYDGWSFYTPQAVVVALDRDQPIWFGRGVDIGGARITTRLSEDDIVVYPDDYVHNLTKHPMNFLGEFLEAQGLGSKTVGIENDCYYFTPRCRDALQESMPNARWQDGGQMVNWLRLIKSDAENEMIGKAARVTEAVMTTFLDVVAPGVRQCDAAGEILKTLARGSDGISGDYCAVYPAMMTGLRASAPHLSWTDEPYVSGEATILEFSGVKNRYHCPMARTLQLGPPPKRLADAGEYVTEGNQRALEAARSGNIAQDVETAWRGVISKTGLVKDSRIGYPVGIGYPPDWGEHTASLRQGDTTVLEPNMVFHLMTGIWMDDFGIEISETFRVTDKGGVPFASVPGGLQVKA